MQYFWMLNFLKQFPKKLHLPLACEGQTPSSSTDLFAPGFIYILIRENQDYKKSFKLTTPGANSTRMEYS